MAEDGREYYALNYDCDWSKASDWVKQNVLAQLPQMPLPRIYGSAKQYQKTEAYKQGWRNKVTIALEVEKFILGTEEHPTTDGYTGRKPEFWADYAAYDWVAICQLFGTMMDLPKGFPMYCHDLQQECDRLGNPELPKQTDGEHNALSDAKHNKVVWQFLREYSEDCMVERI